jgi:hypothetical protein
MASRNQSNNEKTVKSTLRAMPGDFWTIDNISLYCNYKNSVMLPDGFILDEYRDYFEQYLVEVNVSEEYYYSPSLFAEEQYGTADLDFLILYFAGMSSIFEFKQPTIKMLPLTMLTDLNKLMVQMKETVKSSKSNPIEYSELEEIKLPNRGFISEAINTRRNLSSVSVTTVSTRRAVSRFSSKGSYDLPNPNTTTRAASRPAPTKFASNGLNRLSEI